MQTNHRFRFKSLGLNGEITAFIKSSILQLTPKLALGRLLDNGCQGNVRCSELLKVRVSVSAAKVRG